MSSHKVSEETVKKPILKITQSRSFSFFRENIIETYVQSLRKIETYFGLEIDQNSLRLAKIELKNGKISKSSFDKENLSQTEEGKHIDQSLGNLLRRNKYKGEEIHLHVSSGLDVLNKVIQIDLKPGERIEQWILANRAGVFPPLAEDDIYYDYFVVEDGQSNKKLCLSLARKEKIDLILKIAEKYHLNLKKIAAGNFTLHNWLKEYGFMTDDEQPIVVILKDASAEVLFYEKGLPVFVSEMPLEVALNDSQLDNFISSFNELLKLYYGEEVSYLDKKIFLLGESSTIKNLENKLNEEGFESISRDVALNSTSLKNGSIPPEFVNVFALVSQSLSTPNRSTINLLPLDKRKNDLLFNRINRIFNFSFKFTLISLAILIVLNLGLGLYLNQNQEKLNLFESKMSLVNELRKENQVLQEKNKNISNLLINQSKKAQLLSIMSQLSPQGIWLRSLSNESEGENAENEINQIYLSGLSLSESEVSQLVANLELSKSFKEIKVAYLDRVSYQDTQRIPGKYRNSLFKFKIEMKSEI